MSHGNDACARLRDQIALFPDDLNRDERNEVRDHLFACPSCRSEFAALKASRDVFAAAVHPEVVPPGADVSVAPDAAFFADLQEQVLASVSVRRRRPWRSGVAAAACIVLGVALGIGGSGEPRRPTGDGLAEAPALRDSAPFYVDPQSPTVPVSLRARTGWGAVEEAESLLADPLDDLEPGRDR